MKLVGLQSSRKLSGYAIILAALLAASFPYSANAGFLGSAPCVQNIDTTAGVNVYQDGISCFVAFKSVGTYSWTPPTGVSKIDLLVVAGGGGGGARHAGGGGAGGLINSANTTINTSALSITVGSGGNGGAAVGYAGSEGSNGNNSQVSGGGITTQTAIGGGAGAYGAVSGSGGSSGGGGCCGVGQGTATSGQGNTGSAGFQNGSIYVGGGGGGAGVGANGAAGNSSGAGAGGAGQAISWITTSSQSNLTIGQNVSSQIYFSGGGGGSTNNVGTAGAGGNGGGGAGSGTTAAGTNGTSNTGGGGGGGGMNGGGAAKGGDGGSGVVVIRYSVPTFSNLATFSIAENTSTTTNAATVTVSESSTITIRSTLDYSFFSVFTSDSVTARIRFVNSPDYEAFADLGANNDYDLVIRATNTSGNYQEFSIKITLTDVLEAATTGLPTISGAANKGLIVTISISATVPGKAKFLVGGKRISSCLSRSTTGSYPNYVALCSWKPSTSGLQVITAILTPNNGAISAVTSGSTSYLVSRRGTFR